MAFTSLPTMAAGSEILVLDNTNYFNGVVHTTNKRRKCVTNACAECTKRKTKCDGTIPCSNCIRRDAICTYNKKQKRGRKKELERQKNYHETLDLVSTTNTDGRNAIGELGRTLFDTKVLFLSFSLNQYMNLYNTYVTPFLGLPMQNAENLWLTQDSMAKAALYGSLATGAVMCGHQKESEQLIGEARQYLGEVYDVFHPNVVLSHCCMALYYFITGSFEQSMQYRVCAKNMAQVIIDAHPDKFPKNLIDWVYKVYFIFDLMTTNHATGDELNNILKNHEKGLQNHEDIWWKLFNHLTQAFVAFHKQDSQRLDQCYYELGDISFELKNQLTNQCSNLPEEMYLIVKSFQAQVRARSNEQEALEIGRGVYSEQVTVIMTNHASFLSIGVTTSLAKLHLKTMQIFELTQDIELLEWLSRTYPLAKMSIVKVLTELLNQGFKTIGKIDVTTKLAQFEDFAHKAFFHPHSQISGTQE